MNAAEIRSILARHRLAPSRDRGQNFLIDDPLAAALVRLAGVAPGDGVLEIGTGLGILTRALAAAGARVLSVEVDAGLVRVLRQEQLLPDGVRLLHADALKLDLSELLRSLTPPVRLVANLPYSISAPLLRRLLDLRPLLCDWSVMLQRDVAERLLARPGSKAYGSLTVLHQLCVDARRVREIGPQSFYPVPQVRSSFLRMVPLRHGLPASELSRVERVVRAAFGARRKTLVNALRFGGQPAAADSAGRVLEDLGLDPRVRAEALSPESFVMIARVLEGEEH